MTTINVTAGVVSVRFTLGERIGGLVRDLDVPLDQVRAVEVVPDGLVAARGVRAPGLGLPGRRKIGTWRRRGEKSLVSVRRGQPAVQLDLAGARFDRLLLGVDGATAVVERIRQQLGSAPGVQPR